MKTYTYHWAQYSKDDADTAIMGTLHGFNSLKACVASAPKNDCVRFFRHTVDKVEVSKNGRVKVGR